MPWPTWNLGCGELCHATVCMMWSCGMAHHVAESRAIRLHQLVLQCLVPSDCINLCCGGAPLHACPCPPPPSPCLPHPPAQLLLSLLCAHDQLQWCRLRAHSQPDGGCSHSRDQPQPAVAVGAPRCPHGRGPGNFCRLGCHTAAGGVGQLQAVRFCHTGGMREAGEGHACKAQACQLKDEGVHDQLRRLCSCMCPAQASRRVTAECTHVSAFDLNAGAATTRTRTRMCVFC